MLTALTLKCLIDKFRRPKWRADAAHNRFEFELRHDNDQVAFVFDLNIDPRLDAVNKLSFLRGEMAV